MPAPTPRRRRRDRDPPCPLVRHACQAHRRFWGCAWCVVKAVSESKVVQAIVSAIVAWLLKRWLP